MSDKPSASQYGSNRLFFLQQFFKHPLQIGSVIPSSRFLEQRIVEAAAVDSANFIIELGPGTGGTTRALLQAMAPDATLLTVELNPRFHALVSGIEDKRLIAHHGSACDLVDILSRYHLGAANAVISGIPFSTMSRGLGVHIIEAIRSVLAPDGRFVAYQASDRIATLCQPVLGIGASSVVYLNIPPMRVYQWQKKGN
jgi:phospholipid N-methyltransferase